jgi:hypothetical protein
MQAQLAHLERLKMATRQMGGDESAGWGHRRRGEGYSMTLARFSPREAKPGGWRRAKRRGEGIEKSFPRWVEEDDHQEVLRGEPRSILRRHLRWL